MLKTTVIVCTLFTAPFAVDADIFKCTVDGRAVYQPAPCASESAETALKLKRIDAENNARGRALRAENERRWLQEKLLKAQINAQNAAAGLRNQLSEDLAASREQRQQEIDDRRAQWEFEQEREYLRENNQLHHRP